MHFLPAARVLLGRWLPLVLLGLMLWSGDSASDAGVVVGFPKKEAQQWRAEYLGYDRYRQELLRHGFQSDLCAEPLKWPELKEFNVIIYGGFNEASDINAIDAATSKRASVERQALEKFVAGGGGLIVLPTLRRYPGQKIEDYFNLVLEGFGIQILPEGIWDPSHQFKDKGTLAFPPMPYFMTTQITSHAITNGVQRLALPQSYQEAPAVPAISYAKEWTVLVTGESTAESYKRNAEFHLDLKQPGTFKTAPPIAAERSFGKGRVFCYPLPSAHISWNFGNPTWPQTAETVGDADSKKPSFSHQLVLNAIRWVSEPSQKMPDFGTRKVPERVPSAHWDEKVQFPQPPKAPQGPIGLQRGIIGVHSSLSDGQGSVEDYAQAAAAAKLHFLIFAENLEQLTEDKWRKLVEKCQQLSQKGSVLVVPGFEYSDVNGLRWAIWGKQVVYPRAEFFARDGKRIFRDGHLAHSSNFAARMLLSYDKLPGDPSNLWWYYNVPIWVYDGDKLVADNFEQFLLARDNLFAVTATCFTRIKAPSEVAAAAQRCTWNVDPSRHPRLSAAVDTSAAQWNSWTSTSQGGESGPRLEWVELFPNQADGSIYRMSGRQRVRCTFRASAKTGLKEVRLHDGARGMIRRYLCGGAKQFSRTFELVHDRQHELVLEAVDKEGKRAIFTAQRLFSYQQGFFRCGDNLNLLSSIPTLSCPDRQAFPRFPFTEDNELIQLNGFDGLWLNKPQEHDQIFSVRTTAGSQEYAPRSQPGPDDSGQHLVQTPSRFPFSSYEINVVDASSRKYVKKLLQESAHGPFMPTSNDLPYAVVDRRVYLLRSRMNYPLRFQKRRVHESAEDYQGNIFIHEGVVRFRQDATLKGDLPIVLETVDYKGGSAYGQADRVLIDDAQSGEVTLHYGPNDKLHQAGTLRKGGWLAGQFTDGGTLAVVPAVEDMRYEIKTMSTGPKSLMWSYSFGLGRDGQMVRKGEELKYRYLSVCISSRTPKDDNLLKSIGRSFILDPKGLSQKDVEVGQLVNTEIFVTGRAANHEFAAKFQPSPLLIDRPLRIEGIEDNGCVAVYALKGHPWEKRFRFVGVFEKAALFQQNTDQGPTLWVGNPFYAEDAKLRLTLVAEGLRTGERPFLEVHNPTDSAVTTFVRSPKRTPKYGGFSKNVKVPPGDSIFVILPAR